jgi:hypothetical protein
MIRSSGVGGPRDEGTVTGDGDTGGGECESTELQVLSLLDLLVPPGT